MQQLHTGLDRLGNPVIDLMGYKKKQRKIRLFVLSGSGNESGSACSIASAQDHSDDGDQEVYPRVFSILELIYSGILLLIALFCAVIVFL